MIAAWFAKKAGALKWIAAGLLALFVAGVVFAGYRYVSNLQGQVVSLSADLASERFRAASFEATSNYYLSEHNRSVERLQALESARAALERDVASERSKNHALNLEEDMSHDAELAVRNLNARNRELNRMLEHRAAAAGRDGSRAPEGSAPGPPGAP